MSIWTTKLPDYPLLSDQQVRQLLNQSQLGDDKARKQLIESNLRLVKSIVGRFSNRGLEMEDLFQVGCIGLVKAIDDFDLSFAVKFSTYAVPKIIGEIKLYIRESSSIKISRALKEIASDAIAVKDQLTQDFGRSPLIGEIAEKIGVSNETLVSALDAVAPVVSLQAIVHEDEGESILLEDRLAGQDFDSTEDFKTILASLAEDERRLILLRYFAEKSQTEVAVAMGVSQAQVSRLERKILACLRDKLETKG